jgi:D-3-phosphoglycerate dehydrogenase
MPPLVVVSSTAPRAQDIVGGLTAAGYEVRLTPAVPPGPMKTFSGSEIEEIFADADAIISGVREHISGDVLEAASRLRIVSSPIIGTEMIDVDTATEMGLVVGFGAVPENFDGVAESIVMLSAALLKRLPAKWEAARRGEWLVPDVGVMVAKRTIGMIGFGNIGRGVARRLAGWEVDLIAYDPYISPEETALYGVRLVDLDTLLRESDVVSVQVTLTPETRGLMSTREFGVMKPTSYIINTARGPVIDEAALRQALEDGQIAGAAIDVWEQEPTPADNPLRNHPKVIATSHKIGHSIECYDALTVAALQNTVRGLRGEQPLYVRNPKVIPAWNDRIARLASTESAV